MKINEDFLPKEVYSTSEQKTNKVWIDGKPIYRKVINFTGTVSQINGADTILGSISNCDTVTNLSGLYISGSATQQIPFINYVYNSILIDNINMFKIFVTNGDVKVRYYRGNNVPEQTIIRIIVIAEYTKN